MVSHDSIEIQVACAKRCISKAEEEECEILIPQHRSLKSELSTETEKKVRTETSPYANLSPQNDRCLVWNWIPDYALLQGVVATQWRNYHVLLNEWMTCYFYKWKIVCKEVVRMNGETRDSQKSTMRFGLGTRKVLANGLKIKLCLGVIFTLCWTHVKLVTHSDSGAHQHVNGFTTPQSLSACSTASQLEMMKSFRWEVLMVATKTTVITYRKRKRRHMK